jgi:hypothetical protein
MIVIHFPGRIRRAGCFFLVFALAALGFSCSRTEPKITFGFMELVYYPGETRPDERFSFFVIPEDDDGMENLGELYLYNDREGLRWLVNSDDWIKIEYEGKTWIGSRSIAMPGSETLPRGRYRAVLVNKGGEKTERSFTFDAPEDPRFPYPSLAISNGWYRIDSAYPVNRLICYDQEGNTVQFLAIQYHEGNVADLGLPNSVISTALWAEDPDYRCSALTEAVSVR